MNLILIGILMGMTDSFPGVSGGTVAFLSGIYDELLQSIADLKRFKFNWRFFLPLGVGMGCGLFSSLFLIHLLLASGLGSLIFFSALSGFILGLSLSCFRTTGLPLFALGLGTALLLLGLQQGGGEEFSHFWVFLSGIIASIALLLPGISGGLALCCMGVYPKAVHSIVTFSSPLFLFELLLGGVFGLLLFSSPILYLSRNYKKGTTSFFLGMMVGCTNTIFPLESALNRGVKFTTLLLLLASLITIGTLLFAKKRTNIEFNF